ncbi:MAG: PEP-utilizing enzyme [Candidatus Micrarchaeota archaeon]
MAEKRFIYGWSGEQPIPYLYWNVERHVYDRNVPGCEIDEFLVWSQGRYLETYFSSNAVKQLNKEGEKFLDKTFRDNLISETKKVMPYYWETAKRLMEKVKKQTLTNEELSEIYKQVGRLVVKTIAYFATSREEIMYAVEKALADKLEAKYGEKFRDVYLLITMPTEEDVLFREKVDWLQLVKGPSKEKLIAHSLKYPLLFYCIYSEEKALQLLEEKLKKTDVAKLEQGIQQQKCHLQELREKQEKQFAEINNKEIQELAKFIQDQAHYRFEIKACWGGNYYFLPLLKEISKRSFVSVADLGHFSIPSDVIDFLEKGKAIDASEIQKRKRYCLLHLNNGKIDFYSGNEALEKRKELLDSSLPSRDTNEIRGLIANTGKVSGKVKLVKVDNAEEIAKIASEIKPGTILVTGMTNPTMISLMKNVKGIVTDEGGMACHAAIISRELNVPCIVGCRIATRVLSDGDYIELDADNGIVRKLKEGE